VPAPRINDIVRERRDYVASLQLQDHDPGIQGVGLVLLVPTADVARHMSAVRREGFPAYAIHPQGPRDPYTSIVFLEPFEGRNLRAFGHDMFPEPVRRAAMERPSLRADPPCPARSSLCRRRTRSPCIAAPTRRG
jgi:CHASE1-domain containing sensor protein